jgi:hypothetical protein
VHVRENLFGKLAARQTRFARDATRVADLEMKKEGLEEDNDDRPCAPEKLQHEEPVVEKERGFSPRASRWQQCTSNDTD